MSARLRDYFGPEHVWLCAAVHDPRRIARGARCARGQSRARPRTAHAQAAGISLQRDFTTREFAMQHARITRAFLESRSSPDSAAAASSEKRPVASLNTAR